MLPALANQQSLISELNATDSGFPLFTALKGTALTVLVLWTIGANSLVFVLLYKNPKLQTVPNLLVGNLAFSDLCLGLIVLPLSSIYAIAGEWLFKETLCVVFVSADILCSTASIWNLSIVGLDRYWAITSPVAYMSKRNKRTACIMILLVWGSSALISLAPLLGWKQVALNQNFKMEGGKAQCIFLDLPSYTIYSATGSFFIPTIVMYFVYFKIYQAFAKHRARQIYRQKVIRKHIESTILHEISHVLPTSDEFAKEEEEEDESESSAEKGDSLNVHNNGIIIEEDDDVQCDELENVGEMETQDTATYDSAYQNSAKDRESENYQVSLELTRRKQDRGNANDENASTKASDQSIIIRRDKQTSSLKSDPNNSAKQKKGNKANFEKCVAFQPQNTYTEQPMISYEKVKRHKQRKERMYRKSLQKKPKAISAAKERRGVKVLGIILGCFTVCYTPFFIMYVVVQFCKQCNINIHIEMFITWLGYSNSAMNPIIYTVFNRDYQIALKRLFTNTPEKHTLSLRPNL